MVVAVVVVGWFTKDEGGVKDGVGSEVATFVVDRDTFKCAREDFGLLSRSYI